MEDKELLKDVQECMNMLTDFLKKKPLTLLRIDTIMIKVYCLFFTNSLLNVEDKFKEDYIKDRMEILTKNLSFSINIALEHAEELMKKFDKDDDIENLKNKTIH